ncbi:hypothetical protein LOK49_LG02G02914 [Camellia lanceoleosa]|uniref:Uncharacterized protein n=1 Tax=Camellia lanceoleosa TaxID=1840588 RepID=A0ACC0IS06_9ERIC|nr:hypothetical protein LOK49_LG02G02914 [Camellia lanceoleosa]
MRKSRQVKQRQGAGELRSDFENSELHLYLSINAGKSRVHVIKENKTEHAHTENQSKEEKEGEEDSSTEEEKEEKKKEWHSTGDNPWPLFTHGATSYPPSPPQPTIATSIAVSPLLSLSLSRDPDGRQPSRSFLLFSLPRCTARSSSVILVAVRRFSPRFQLRSEMQKDGFMKKIKVSKFL